MLYTNAFVFLRERGFIRGGFSVENGRFVEVFTDDRPGGENLRGTYVIPGLVDIHTHGAVGADFSDGKVSGLRRMAAHLASRGVTSFVPTSMTLPYESLSLAFDTAAELFSAWETGCARVVGVHMEGPFFSEKKKGAQNADYLRFPDYSAFRALFEGCGGLVRIVDLAPELPHAADFIKKASKLCTVSVAHTDAGYEDAVAGYEAGAHHLTHLFNAMPPFHHREPGVIGAAADREGVTAELICDGYHVHPSAVRMAFRLFPDRICLVSDSLRCCGMPDGEYELGGQKIILSEGVARLENGTMAGAASDLYTDMQNAISFGISRHDAILAATLHPAQVIGCDGEIGSIEPGKLADFVLCDEGLSLLEVYIGGVRVETHNRSFHL